MRGFFEPSQVISRPKLALLPKCGACGLSDKCRSPMMGVSGEGKRGILLIGSTPERVDDRQGEHFQSSQGKNLRKVLASVGVDLDRDCWSTNAMICRTDGSEEPSAKEIDYCRPNLTDTIAKLNPRVIIPLGFSAMKSLLVPYFREGIGAAAVWVGWQIPLQSTNTWICPTYGFGYIREQIGESNGPVVSLLFRRHLEAAVNLLGRPWEDTPPDYKSQVRLMYDETEIERWVINCIDRNQPTSFDWETNCLKPDRSDSAIVSAGFHSANETVAFEVRGQLIHKVLAEFCSSDVPKIGANCKFEDRWARKILKVERVVNWVWDTMDSAHHLDNRPDITSVKFQAFVRLGQEAWDYGVKPYFEAPDAVSLNRIREVDIRTLLIYNGIDAVVEYEIAKRQREHMKWMNV